MNDLGPLPDGSIDFDLLLEKVEEMRNQDSEEVIRDINHPEFLAHPAIRQGIIDVLRANAGLIMLTSTIAAILGRSIDTEVPISSTERESFMNTLAELIDATQNPFDQKGEVNE